MNIKCLTLSDALRRLVENIKHLGTFFGVLAVIFIGNSYICSQVFAQCAMPFAVRGR